MRFSKGTTASLIATTTTATVAVIVLASSSSHAANTTQQSAAAADNVAQAPPFHNQHRHEVDYADTDTGILSSLSRRARSLRLAVPFTDHHLDHEADKTAATTSNRRHGSDGEDGVDDSSSRELQGWCSEGFVDCSAGMDSTSSSTCAASCIVGGISKCCSGSNACSGFTGKVCKDGTSCIGDCACDNAVIPQVKNSCTGNFACFEVGMSGGTVGNIQDSCIGADACNHLAYAGCTVGEGDIQGSCTAPSSCNRICQYGVSVGYITNSCTADRACEKAAMYGTVGNIVNSCTAQWACQYSGNSGATGGGVGGLVGNLVNSCTGLFSCKSLGYSGTVGNLQGSCTGSDSCKNAGYSGTVGNLASSCTLDYSCQAMGVGGDVGNLQDSCKGLRACEVAGAHGGSIGGTSITTSCNADYACKAAGSYPSNSIVSKLNNCCNGSNMCEGISEATLPGECTATATTAPPLAPTTALPSTAPITTTPSFLPTTSRPSNVPTTAAPSLAPTTAHPSNAPTTAAPTFSPTMALPSNAPITTTLSFSPTTARPSNAPTTAAPTFSPTTALPSNVPTTAAPTFSPTTARPSNVPTTAAPTFVSGTTSVPSAPQPPTTTSSTKVPTTSPIFVTLSFVGGCPPQIRSIALFAGQHYEPGDRVSKGAIVFECKSWPNSLFCSQAAFNPPDSFDSKSSDWKRAWDAVGYCSGALTLPVAGCPDAWTSGDMTKYKENDQVSVIKLSSPLIQVIYKCKAWPYSWYCGQLGPLNHNGGVLGWDLVGDCAGTSSPTISPTFDPLTMIISGCPDDYYLATIENYVAGAKVSVSVVGSSSYKNVYVCRDFPYSGYCSQSGFAPGEQYDYMAWTLLGPCDGTLSPTPAPSAYTGGASCTYTKVVTTTPTPTPVVTPVGTWTAGTLYEAGDQVRIGATKFQCKPWPFYLWCRMSAYKPTLSAAGLWTEAWTLAGTCPPVPADPID